jgi:hypothetical protein
LQKSFSNQNFRQRSLASNTSKPVTTFTENGPFQGYTSKTALFRATQEKQPFSGLHKYFKK